ncbi:bifunctional serine/threonine-protein kinase/formylglycine-generating enzyme family protein [Cellvibrio mixtus]|uniref:bifunctional serine/threonine-protein kinase/formylglycine-generating enzyme family protein n=1 Tax=Cellvibrio mixtus TaxID=39650 RepID=UPI0006950CD9|nr:bifunctional serine/threonine-protein kinase/formylglycine-generating enzyme family protein [Cellvibrio mixtus]
MQIPGYTIIKKINAGGMATVFLATQHSVGRTVALKIMKPLLDKDPEFHQRFQREANIIGQLSHPNIIPIYDIGRHEGLNYISMEFLPKGSLEEKIKQGITPEQAIKITIGIAAALEQAHNKGYMHRDIKPENILFRDDGSPVLTDFGIARTIKSKANMTQVGTVIGTPYYMSPEQAKGEPSDGRSDLYSLGVVLYEMLTGEKLFHADSSLAISVKHIHEQPPQLPEHLSALQTILDKLLAKNPELRFQTARELIEKLETISLHNIHLNTRKKFLPFAFLTKIGQIIGQDAKLINTKTKQLWQANKKIDPPFIRSAEAAQTLVANSTQIATRIASTIPQHTIKATVNHSGLITRLGIYSMLIFGFMLFGWRAFFSSEQPSAKEQWASITGQQDTGNIANPALIPLTVNPIPEDARVRILNIREKYIPGIELPGGTYHLEISYPGYATKKKWIRLNTQNSSIDIALQKTNQTQAGNTLPLPELVLIKAGSFFMGNPGTQGAQVTIARDFYISRYEITFNEYDFFAVETNRALPDDNGWGRGERPIINISWDDANAYINWLNKTTGKTYRLPTAAEWEYAARGNTTSSYWWGNNTEDARGRTNCRFGCKSWWDSFFNNKTQVVGAFPPNDFGVHDTAGNVAEWTSDCADAPNPSATPQTVCLKRAVRGGAFTSKVENITVYSQIAFTATKSRNNIGFRVLQEIPQVRIIEDQSNMENQPRRRNIFRELRDSIFNRDN